MSTHGELGDKFIGSIFRGWLGYVLKCDVMACCSACDKTFDCPYFMVFKEQSGVRPYSLLAFSDHDKVCGFIRLYGDKRRFAPRILSDIKRKEKQTHFGGLGYRIDSIEAKNQEIRSIDPGDRLRIVTVSPLHLVRNGDFEVLPSLNTILRASLRTYNRIAKYHDQENYPLHVKDEIISSDASIIDFDICTKDHIHTSMNKKKIKLSGSVGWIEYDTSGLSGEIGRLLGIGEALQIGKHTAYGFGGIMALSQEDRV